MGEQGYIATLYGGRQTRTADGQVETVDFGVSVGEDSDTRVPAGIRLETRQGVSFD